MAARDLSVAGSLLAAALLLATGCLQSDPPPRNQDDPQTNQTAPDAGDVSDAANDEDVDDGDAANDDNVVEPEPWDCDPEFELDAERYAEYEDIEDGELLAGQLYDDVRGHDDRGYDAARELLWDIDTRDHGELECVYTDARVEADGTNLPGDKFNTEHTWPRSRGAGDPPEKSDVHHLFAVEIEANERRANHEFGHVSCDESTCDWHRDGSYLGPSADDDRDPVFEVQPERRGDVARVILYYSLRYDEPISDGEESVLREWNCQDPPDDYEANRNDEIEAFQGNRNPFIDRPDFVDRIDEF